MRFIYFFIFSFISFSAIAQASPDKINIKFKSSRAEITDLSKLMTIYNFRNDTIFASVEKSRFAEFQSLNISYEIIEKQSIVKNTQKSASLTGFDYYPKHSEYVGFLQNLTQTYPKTCTLFEFGKSVKGRSLYVLRINSDTLLPKPSVMYTSSMHGDESGGFILMLRLSDYLLKNYGKDTMVTRLLNNTDIWINPLANPDGTYGDGDEFSAPVRENANGVDLNRNFPDPFTGATYGTIQPENTAMMNLMKSRKFVLSANFHSGAEVVNYPWDTESKLHPDDFWFKYVSKMFADTSKKYGRANYFTSVSTTGYTNGYQWYPVHGGRQDYITFWNQGRELTIEIDNNFITPANQLNNLWNYNYRSLLNYLNQATYGIHGVVLDSASQKPIKAKIEVVNHDFDSSFVFSNANNGWFYRLINDGTYNLRISAEDYYTKEISNVQVQKSKTTYVSISLSSSRKTKLQNLSSPSYCTIFPNPSRDYINLSCNNGKEIIITDLEGRIMLVSKGESIINITALKNGVYILQQHEFKSIFVKN